MDTKKYIDSHRERFFNELFVPNDGGICFWKPEPIEPK